MIRDNEKKKAIIIWNFSNLITNLNKISYNLKLLLIEKYEI